MLTPEHRKEALARAYIQAVAGRVGLSYSHREHDYGIDITLHEVVIRTEAFSGKRQYVEAGVPLDIQAKSATTATLEDSCVKYDLDINNYNDLCDTLAKTPRILVLLVLPAIEGDQFALD